MSVNDDKFNQSQTTADDSAIEMFAAFGLTFFIANALENDIIDVMILVWMGNQSHPPSSQEIGEVFDRHSGKGKTMGILIGELKKIIDVEETLSDSLDEALEIRNWLAHRFFRDRSVEICTEPGKKTVTAELKSKFSTLCQTRNHVLSIIKNLREQIGISDEMLDRYHNDLITEYIDGESRDDEDE